MGQPWCTRELSFVIPTMKWIWLLTLQQLSNWKISNLSHSADLQLHHNQSMVVLEVTPTVHCSTSWWRATWHAKSCMLRYNWHVTYAVSINKLMWSHLFNTGIGPGSIGPIPIPDNVSNNPYYCRIKIWKKIGHFLMYSIDMGCL